MSVFQRFKHLIGEISALRQRPPLRWVSPFSHTYTVDSSRVDYDLARELYRNTSDRYKLGAAFAKPTINIMAGFMGPPTFTHPDLEADLALTQVVDTWAGKVLRINRDTLRDGDVFARIVRVRDRFNPQKSRFDLVLIPPEQVLPVFDPISGDWKSLIIRHPVRITDATGRETGRYHITETLTPGERIIEADQYAPAEIRTQNRTEPNPWGFIPVVHFKNEAAENQIFGVSDLEAIEPFMKIYHDTLLFAVQGSKLFSRPKTKFTLRDVQKFLADNFSSEEIAAGKLKFADKELFLMQEGDNAGFITADSGLVGVTSLLEFIFLNIVDVSQIPEFAFGAAVASSKASVSEQMIPLLRNIRRKRSMFEEYYGDLASMFLAMWSKVENRSLESYQVSISWEEITPKEDAQIATTIKTLTEGLTLGVESGLLSHEAASEFLRGYIPSMLPFADESGAQDERGRIAKSMLWRKRIEDVEGWREPEA